MGVLLWGEWPLHWSIVRSSWLLTWGTILVAGKSADLRHHLHQGLHVLHYGALELRKKTKAATCSGLAERTHWGFFFFSSRATASDSPTVFVRGSTCATHQAFHHLQQLLHHHGDALVAQESAHDLDVRRSNKVSVGSKYAAVGHVQGLWREGRRWVSLIQQSNVHVYLVLVHLVICLCSTGVN